MYFFFLWKMFVSVDPSTAGPYNQDLLKSWPEPPIRSFLSKTWFRGGTGDVWMKQSSKAFIRQLDSFRSHWNFKKMSLEINDVPVEAPATTLIGENSTPNSAYWLSFLYLKSRSAFYIWKVSLLFPPIFTTIRPRTS